MTITTSHYRVKPCSVFINWSESNEFNTGEIYNFMDFEHKALEVAKSNPLGGYDKTNITATFENGDEHQCRLDLGAGGNDIGFAEHCLIMIEYDRNHRDDPDFVYRFDMPHHQQLIRLISTYQFDFDFVSDARLQIKAVIVATYSVYDEENSEPFICQYESKTIRTIILGWSNHTRRLFPELRKACLNHPYTAFLHDKSQSKEHRNNYSMGDGTYLTNKEYIYHGWQIRKHIFWNETDKTQYIPSVTSSFFV